MEETINKKRIINNIRTSVSDVDIFFSNENGFKFQIVTTSMPLNNFSHSERLSNKQM